jgi:FkbM family methyltransferase
MLEQSRLLAKMFLDYRKHSGAHNFRFRPRLQRQNGMDVVDVRARAGEFDAKVFLRPGTSDWAVFEQVFLAGHYDVSRLARFDELNKLYHSFARPLILDLGANVGLASLYLMKSWPTAMVVAVEPDAENVKLLRLNASRAEIVQAAIASERCRVKIANPDAPAWSYQTERSDHGAIEGITVSTILDKFPMHQPFICKVDIEGAEIELFSKNANWVQRFPIIIMEPHDWMLQGRATARNFLRIVAELDRDFFVIGENIWSVSNVACTRQS